MGFDFVLFLLFAVLAVGFAVGMLLSENAVHSALFLIGNFGSVAFLFMTLDAPFIAMVQIAVYAGAIMVLFLFVIMLLGAERTTDTTRRFRWLAGMATTLGVALLISLGIPLVAAGFDLPEYEGDAPQVRVVHGALAPAVNIELRSDVLEQPLLLEAVDFGTISDFLELPAGDYDLLIASAEDGSVLLDAPLSFEPGQRLTAIAYGQYSPPAEVSETAEVDDAQATEDTAAADTTAATAEADVAASASTFGVAVLANDLGAPGGDNARLLVFNGFVDAPIALVDLGPNDVLDVVVRAGDTEPSIFDYVIADGIGFGEAVLVPRFSEGDYNLAIVDTSNLDTSAPSASLLLNLFDFTIERDTEQTIAFVGEPPQRAGDPVRRVVLDRNQDELTLETEPDFGAPRGIGRVLFIDYILPVNIVGFLLLVALIGVIVLTRPEGPSPTRRRPQRRKVSRPLVSVLAQQTGSDVTEATPQLDQPKDA